MKQFLSISLIVMNSFIASFSDNFDNGNLSKWQAFGNWSVENGQLTNPTGGNIFYKEATYSDFTYEADISVSEKEEKAGLLFRATKDDALDFKGYFVDLHLVPGRIRVEIRKVDHYDYKVLSDAEVIPGKSSHIKVVCKGPYIWVFFDDMTTPILCEYDTTFTSGAVGFRSEKAHTYFDNAKVSGEVPSLPTPLVKDWSYIRGAVYTSSNAVNATQTMEEFNPALINRELSYAKTYGFNTIAIYLHWLLWDQYHDQFLQNFEQFLSIADKNGLKVTPILFDPDCGTSTPAHLAPYDLPTPGIHNSQMNRNPGEDIKVNHYDAYSHTLKAYTLAVVNAHKNDPRIIFWQACNEPLKGESSDRLTKDASEWIRSTGTKIPVTSTGSGFFGPKYSDFYTFHMYGADSGDDGGPEHLCTECLNRPAQNFLELADNFEAKKTGFIIWDLMIGRDNCRFPWGSPLNAAEPAIPFHGFIYPDGHPWSVAEARRLKGNSFDKTPFFRVEYYTGIFDELKKVSVTPAIDFNLGNEPGTGSPDASAGIPVDSFSIKWIGKFSTTENGAYTFYADGDTPAKVWVNNQLLENNQAIPLKAGQNNIIRVEYIHYNGDSKLHLQWSGPHINKQTFVPNKVI
ncbi:family 16 glycoside hydrolase [Chitinophaga sancti]|uniref:PA14 domain-containing protein n=1 Tax=Chitinophaga sancti TaxID=1004 RepID=A0A1K1LQW3_9BACT|nr:family 16 glycoside hydrolase [Chitinophaga sancti]WQD64918.1 PA14 domain-containing protein [Chitinophaga sancti]WQG89458.1 PA14 domain-containing protein [Chitinophaga sancti]SFW13255.1 PA14 domain-containing protein [Chitinophaga sancti]